MSSVLRDMTLADLRNMLIIKISHKENNFLTSSGILTTEFALPKLKQRWVDVQLGDLLSITPAHIL